MILVGKPEEWKIGKSQLTPQQAGEGVRRSFFFSLDSKICWAYPPACGPNSEV